MADAGAGGRTPAEPTFAPAAEAEFLAAIRFYARQRPGLGAAFLTAIETTVARAAAAPGAGAPLGGHIRRRLAPGFPSQVVYRTDVEHAPRARGRTSAATPWPLEPPLVTTRALSV